MEKHFIPYYEPDISESEVEAVSRVLRSNWITTGKKADEFEQSFRKLVGAESALALNSCTAALHLALLIANIGEGDEVITSPFTFASTANVIEHTGAKPVFADISPASLTINPEEVQNKITKRTKAVIPVHYGGHSVDIGSLTAIADEHKLTIIEDAAHGLETYYRDKPVGSWGNLTAFSFYTTKNITTGEGGMLTGSKDLLLRARELGLHGMNKAGHDRFRKGGSWAYQIAEPGFKYNLTDIAATIGLEQMKRLKDFQRRRSAIAMRYNEVFSRYKFFQIPEVKPWCTHSWHLYVIRLNLETINVGRDRLIEELFSRGIGTSVHYTPVHMHPFYADKYGYSPKDLPVAEQEFHRIISLPLYPRMTDESVERVVSTVVDIAKLFEK